MVIRLLLMLMIYSSSIKSYIIASVKVKYISSTTLYILSDCIPQLKTVAFSNFSDYNDLDNLIYMGDHYDLTINDTIELSLMIIHL